MKANEASLFPPNRQVLNLFHGFPTWGQVVESKEVETRRLNDVPETAGATFIEMDIQGAELLALQHAPSRLRDALVLHLEVGFVSLYRDQPLFSDVERFLRGRGFMLHKFSDTMSRVVQQMMLNNSIFAGLNQLLWADAVFMRDLAAVETLSPKQLIAFAAIVHECYKSIDISLHLLQEHDRRSGGNLASRYLAGITGASGSTGQNNTPLPQAIPA